MQITLSDTSPRYLAGMTTGTLVLTCFGALWSLQGPRIMLLITPVVTVVLMVLCFTTKQTVRQLPQKPDFPEEQTQNQKVARRFGMVCAVEIAAIVAAVVLLRLFTHSEYIAPAICLIVGLHFFPLASLFKVQVYTLTGVALSLLAVGALLALLFGVTFGTVYTWPAIVGLGGAGVLWLTSLFNLASVRQALRLKQV